MQPMDEALQSIRSQLSKQPRNRHDAAALAYELFSYLSQHPSDGQLECELRNAFQRYIQRNSFDELIEQHVEYAIRIALSANDLLYEEILKLFYVCDEIKALSSLGFELDSMRENKLTAALRARFAREPAKSQVAAQQNVEAWKSDWYWYKSNLPPSRSA